MRGKLDYYVSEFIGYSYQSTIQYWKDRLEEDNGYLLNHLSFGQDWRTLEDMFIIAQEVLDEA